MRFHWFLPSNGDGRFVANVIAADGVRRGQVTRPASVEYLGQVARAAEQSGFFGALTPTGAGCEDAWILTAALSQVTERLTFVVAFRPGLLGFGPTLVNLLHRSSADELLAPAPVGTPGDGARIVFTVAVPDTDEYCRTLAGLGIALLNGPVTRPWGPRTASVADPDGHVWELAS